MIKINTKHIKAIILILFFICIFAFQKSNYLSIKTTIALFLDSVLPSLFPFILFTNILIQTNFKEYIFYVFKQKGYLIYVGIIGFLCGYPSGAKAAMSLYEQNLISTDEVKYLMTFANNCNPIFILSTVGICFLDNLYFGIVLLISHYLSSIILCIFNLTHNNIIHENNIKSNEFRNNSDKKLHKSFFEMIDVAIKNTFIVLGTILGYITLFNLVFSILQVILTKLNISNNIICILSGLFESTKGIKDIFLNTNISLNITLSIISFILSFSGLSIIFQIYSSIYKAKVKLSHIIKYKLIQGMLSGIITYIILNITTCTKVIKINMLDFNQKIYYLICVCLLFILSSTIKKVTRKN